MDPTEVGNHIVRVVSLQEHRMVARQQTINYSKINHTRVRPSMLKE